MTDGHSLVEGKPSKRRTLWMGERERKECNGGEGKERMSEERKNLGIEEDKEMVERGSGWERKGAGYGALQGIWVGG